MVICVTIEGAMLTVNPAHAEAHLSGRAAPSLRLAGAARRGPSAGRGGAKAKGL